MKCKHKYIQILNQKGKPSIWQGGNDRATQIEFYCEKCLERGIVISTWESWQK